MRILEIEPATSWLTVMLTPENIVVLRAEVQCLQSKLAAERGEAYAQLQNSLFSQSPVEKGYPILFWVSTTDFTYLIRYEPMNVNKEGNPPQLFIVH